MTRSRGGALAGCLLVSWAVTAQATTTVTQQSSSAWGSVEGGRTVDRGTHTSHTSGVLPDGDDTELSVRFGFDPPRRAAPQPEQQPELGLGGGFGSDGRWTQQVDPVTSQQPLPTQTGGQAPAQQPVSGVDAINDAYRNLLAQYPNFNWNIGPQYPWQQQPGYNAAWPAWQGQQPNIDFRGGFGIGAQLPQGAGSGAYDPARQLPAGSAPGGVPVQTTETQPAAGSGTPQQGVAPFPGGAGQAVQGTGNPGLGTPGYSNTGSGYPAFGVSGVPAAGGPAAAYPTFSQSGYPLFQMPNINPYVSQLTRRALENIARGMSAGASPGAAAPGVSDVQMRHGLSSGGSQPGQSGVQSQHAAVNSFSFQPSHPQPSARPAYPNAAISFPQYDGQRPLQQQPSAWPQQQQPGAWPQQQQG